MLHWKQPGGPGAAAQNAPRIGQLISIHSSDPGTHYKSPQ